MTVLAESVVGLVLGLAILVYLFYALSNPERF